MTSRLNDTATIASAPYEFAKTWRSGCWRRANAPWDLVVLNPCWCLDRCSTRSRARRPVDAAGRAANAFQRTEDVFGIVDARDVAARTSKPVDAQTRPADTSTYRQSWLHEIGAELQSAYPERNIRTRRLPNLLVRLSARFDKRVDAKVLDDTLDRVPHYDGRHAPAALGFSYRDVSDTLRDTAQSMIDQSFV